MDERGLLMEGALKLKDLTVKVCIPCIFQFLSFNISKLYLYFCFLYSNNELFALFLIHYGYLFL